MADPRRYHFKLPSYQGPRLPEPPHAWYPNVQLHSPRCTSERTGRGDGRIRAFVIHATAGNSSAGAMSVMLRDHTASWHWLVPDENEAEHGNHVWACAPEKRAAWHVRNDRSHPDVQNGARYVNYWSLGMELVNTQSRDPFSEWQVEQAAALVRYAWSKYPDLVDVVSHAKLDPSRRSDPGAAFQWERFKELVLAPTPVMVAVRAPAARRGRTGTPPAVAPTAPAAPEPTPVADEYREPPVRLVGPDGRPIDIDARRIDGVTMAEARPLVEALGFDVSYGQEDGRGVVRIAARAPAALSPAASSRWAVARRRNATAEAREHHDEVPTLAGQGGRPTRRLDAVRDSLDFRDQMFVPTLVEVPLRRTLDAYRRTGTPILDQKGEGACTGFGLATVANYLLRTRRNEPDRTPVSARMFYEVAKRYDEWGGVSYEGSSARGAMKGWHKHGVCCDKEWPYRYGTVDRDLTPKRSEDAVRRPLGAYFRVNHRDLIAMHTAIAQAGILYATAGVHEGWEEVDDRGRIPWSPNRPEIGGHAFAIAGYDEDGFWIQNSWGEDWGLDGFAQVSYDDWLVNGTDVWVARLGAPVMLQSRRSTARGISSVAGGSRGYVYEDLRPHVISLGNDGELRTSGTYGTSRSDVERMIREDLSDLTAEWPTDRPKRILLYAHGGLVPEASAIQRIADYRPALMKEFVFPISLIWKTDYWSTITNVLQDAKKQRLPETGIFDAAKDFMLDRLDDMLEPLARTLTGRTAWVEMKENARRASEGPHGGAALLAELLAELDGEERRRTGQGLEIHLVAHSAGSLLFAPLVPLLTGTGSDGHALKLETVTLWAPACTVDMFEQTYRPAIADGRIGRFALYTLTDQAERDDDCAGIYRKSLLYLVSHAFEDRPRTPFRPGTPILGMERAIRANPALLEFLQSGPCEWVRAPNTHYVTGDGKLPIRLDMSSARHHGDFDDDPATVSSTLARILGRRRGEETLMAFPTFDRTRAGLREVRQELARVE